MRAKYFRLVYLGSEQEILDSTKQEALELINDNEECFSDETELHSYIAAVDETKTLQEILGLMCEINQEISEGRERLAEKEMADNPDFIFDYEDEASALRLDQL